MDDKILCDVTNKTIPELDVEFRENFNTTFSDQIEQKINNIIQKERIKTAKALKADIENQINGKKLPYKGKKRSFVVINHHGISTF